MILLDTCALLWLNTDRSAFTAKALNAMKRNSDGMAFSPVSVMEVAIKVGKGKLELPLPTAEWFERLVETYSLIQIPLSFQIACEVTNLPALHSDPFDRMILATARLNHLSVVTSDSAFCDYPGITVIW